MKYKVVFCDYDGTLVGKDQRMSAAANTVIREYSEAGGKFVIATGRSFHGMVEESVKSLHLTTLQIAHGGAEIVNPITRLVEEANYITPEDSQMLAKRLGEYGLWPELSLFDDTYADQGKIIARPGTSSFLPLSQLDSKEAVAKIRVVVQEPQLVETEKILKELVDPLSTVTFFQSNTARSFGFDITSVKATKEHAINSLLTLYGHSASDAAAIGDGLNDEPLFKACGYKVAMGHSPSSLIEQANYVCPPIDQDGVVDALKHIMRL